jgi:pimeloyl-ACP methyl ester carboxylesterase
MDLHESRHPGPRWLYLHGFASSARSAKGVALAEHYATKGIELQCLDLRQPSLPHLRLSAIVAHVRKKMGDARDRVVLFGSSLGGLTACRVAEADARACALVLLAPAFALAAGWKQRLGDEGFRRWQDSGWLETLDHATNQNVHVDFRFISEVAEDEANDGGFPDVRVPTLIVHGVRDETVSVERSRTFARGKRHVRLVEVDDGHELVASLPRIAAEADAFLTGFLGD